LTSQGAFFCTFPELSTTALAPIWTALRKLRKLQRRSRCQTALGELHRRIEKIRTGKFCKKVRVARLRGIPCVNNFQQNKSHPARKIFSKKNCTPHEKISAKKIALRAKFFGPR
jgi:hypothetical protein